MKNVVASGYGHGESWQERNVTHRDTKSCGRGGTRVVTEVQKIRFRCNDGKIVEESRLTEIDETECRHERRVDDDRDKREREKAERDRRQRERERAESERQKREREKAERGRLQRDRERAEREREQREQEAERKRKKAERERQ